MPASAEDDIRALMAEAQAMKTKPLPGAMSIAWNHPGVVKYGVDTQQEWDNDQRRAFVLKRLSEKYPGGEGLPIPLGRAGLPLEISDDVAAYERGEMKDIDTPYHYRGWYTAGAPLHNVMQYMGSIPAMAYAGSGMLANAMDPEVPYNPDAKKEFQQAANTALGYIPEAVGLVPKGTKTYADVAQDARHQRGEFPWYATNEKRKEYNAAVGAEANQKVNDLYLSGSEHYMRQGMPEIPALFMGALSDSLLDPYGGWVAASKLARQGKHAQAAWNLAKEWGMGQGFAGAAAGMKLASPGDSQ